MIFLSERLFRRPPEPPDRAPLHRQEAGMLRAHVQRRRQVGRPIFRNLHGVQARSAGAISNLFDSLEANQFCQKIGNDSHTVGKVM